MYWGRNLEQILFFVEGTGSWPFPSKVPVELPSPPFPASRGLHDDHFQQGWCKTSLLSSHPSSPSCLPGGFLELCRWNCTGWVSTSVYKWHSVWGFFVFVWLVWGFFGGGILLFFFFFHLFWVISDWSSSPKSAPQPLCLQLCLSWGELAGQAGMSGCERRRAGSVYTGFSTSKNYSMELHSQQTIWLLRHCSKHMIYPRSSKQIGIEPVC